jgi:hypothetical protein
MAADGIDLVLVGVLEQEESIQQAQAALRSWGVDAPFAVDRGGTVMRKYGLDGPPASVVLDATGAVRWISPSGETSPEAVLAAARQAAAGECSR